MDEYSIRLIKKYGPGILLELNKEKRKIKQFTPQELEAIINKYKGREK